MSWNIEPQQMLYVTGIVALYGAVLSTLNFVREQRKDEIKLEITVKDALRDPPIVWVQLIKVVNNSSFEIEITSLGFVLDSQNQLVFMPDDDRWYEVPDIVSSRKSRDYPIRIERVKTLLSSNGINGKVRMRPFVIVNGRSFFGRSFLFDSEITT